MSGFDDYRNEMSRGHLDDDSIDAVLAGQVPPGHDDLAPLASFVTDLRTSAAGPVPPASAALAAVLADGLTTEKGDLPVTVGSSVNGPVEQAAGPSKWRRRLTMNSLFAVLGTKLAGLALGSKVALAATLTAGTVAAAGATGALPEPVQDKVGQVVSAVTPFEVGDKVDGEGRENRPDHAGPSELTGTARANETPAGDHRSDKSGKVDKDGKADDTDEATNDEKINGDRRPAHAGPSDLTGTARAAETPAGDHLPEHAGPSDVTGTARADETPAGDHRPDKGGKVDDTDDGTTDDGEGDTTTAVEHGRPADAGPPDHAANRGSGGADVDDSTEDKTNNGRPNRP